MSATGTPTASISESGALPGGVSFHDNGNGTASLSGTPSTSGVYPLTITAQNGVNPNANQSFTLTVKQAPVITSGNSTTFVLSTAGSFTVTTSGYPGISISESGGLPAGVSFHDNGNGTATLSGTPGASGTFPITITAQNGVSPNATQNFTLTVNAANHAPAITSGNSTNFLQGVAGSFSVTTTGTPTPSISESGGLPSGVTFHDNGNGTATLSGTTAASGNFPITITAQNGVSPNATQNFTLIVKAVNHAPAITSGNSTTFTVGVSGSFSVTTTGTPTPSISESGGLPSGVTFHDNGNGTATLGGTPTASGSFPITITAQNGVSPNATQNFTLTVNAANHAPAITSASSTTFSVGVAGSFSVTTTGTPTPSISESGGLPSGVTFHDNGNGTATLGGTPAASGSFPITITAQNGVSPNATQNFTLTVNAGGPTVTVSPTSFDFGNVYQGTSKSHGVTLKNTGSSTLQISSISVAAGSGSDATDFTRQSNCGSSLGAGKSCTITVTFSADDHPGSHLATLNITDNGVGSPQQVALAANVINPVPKFDPSSLSFGTHTVNSSTTKTVTLTSNGTTALNVASISITGSNASDFKQTNNCPASLSPGSFCTISVTFKPTKKGSRSAGVTVSDNASSGSQTVALSGTGN